ncbi:unnamed protein product [Urochloa humidicola]
MVKKLALISSLFFNSSETISSSTSMSGASFSTAASWHWPSCTQPRTLSFRRDSPEIVSMRHCDSSSKHHEHEEYKTTMNPAYALDNDRVSSCRCSLLSDSDDISLSTAPDELIIHGLRSNSRLFFEPESTSSIANKKQQAAAFGGATALAIESGDPYGDFRRSMEEMVLSHGVEDWGWLEEMLAWYLRANGKSTHGLIVGAFVDLLVALASSSPACSSSAFRHQSAKKKGSKQSDHDHDCSGPIMQCN